MKYVHELPCYFKPKGVGDLIRLGVQRDGGYVVPKRVLRSTDAILSFGLNDEWSFERNFYKISNCRVLCFDPSVSWIFWCKSFSSNILAFIFKGDVWRLKRAFRWLRYISEFYLGEFEHYKKFIGYNNSSSISLREALKLIDRNSSVYLKIDIEGSEYRIMDQISELHDKFNGFSIELHDVDLHVDFIKSWMADIKKHFLLVHIHANNYLLNGRDDAPTVYELSFLNRNLVENDEIFMIEKLPRTGIDYPNNPNRADVELIFSG